MMRQDLEQLETDKAEFEKNVRKGDEDRPILLYAFLRGRWVVKCVWTKKSESLTYVWLFCILAILGDCCFAPVVAAIRNGVVAPT